MPQGVCISWFGCQVAESELVSAQILRDDIRGGKSDKQIYDRLTTEYGEPIPYYSAVFDAQTAVLWLGPVRPLYRSFKLWTFWCSNLLAIIRK